MATFSQRVSDVVLRSCQQHAPQARIASVLRDSEGRTVIRLSAGEAKGSVKLLGALQQLWPLAKTSVLENVLDNSVQAELTVPSESDEWKEAKRRAAASAFAKISLAIALLFLALGSALYASELADHSPTNHTEL
mgnify:CR=1 FL=1|tara:strand:+ start:123 stop:527 length:405 start_codon:yes stop_codon:yes gene_type:complete